ncbi:unnamed protein product [Linum trigynum]|uniref:Uncharacterized protein n=1 Tax=Linum trigynum TaxID=586398 RepID=A0AAV2GLI8_9ROSI
MQVPQPLPCRQEQLHQRKLILDDLDEDSLTRPIPGQAKHHVRTVAKVKGRRLIKLANKGHVAGEEGTSQGIFRPRQGSSQKTTGGVEPEQVAAEDCILDATCPLPPRNNGQSPHKREAEMVADSETSLFEEEDPYFKLKIRAPEPGLNKGTRSIRG